MSVNKLKDLNENTYIFRTNAMSIIILQTIQHILYLLKVVWNFWKGGVHTTSFTDLTQRQVFSHGDNFTEPYLVGSIHVLVSSREGSYPGPGYGRRQQNLLPHLT